MCQFTTKKKLFADKKQRVCVKYFKLCTYVTLHAHALLSTIYGSNLLAKLIWYYNRKLPTIEKLNMIYKNFPKI